MNRYFLGQAHDLGHVSALPCATFAELCIKLREPVELDCTRAEFHSAEKGERDKLKRVAFLTPATFEKSPAVRRTENAQRCNLIALDIDDPNEAARLLEMDWNSALGFAHIVWHTASSTEEKPRLRVLVAAESIKPEDYQAAARTVAEMIGMTSITSQVIFHCVQPMFVPTRFAGDESDPIVACEPEGDAFMAFDIISDVDESGVTVPTLADGDLDFLRAPLEGITLEHAKDAIAALDPDCPMQQWIEVAAGLKHQFDSDEAYALWDSWSAKGKKYVDADETRYRWNSLKANPPDRAPVTIRSLFRLAQARGWSNATLCAQNHQRVLHWIRSPSRSTEELLDQGVRQIAQASTLVRPLEKKTLMLALRDVLAARTVPLPLSDIKKALRDLELSAAKNSGVPPWCKGLCYVTALNSFYRHTTDRKFIPEVFDLMYACPVIGDEKALRPRDYAVQIAAIPQVENLRYDPAQKGKRFFTEGGVPYVNTYRPDFAPPTPETADDAGAIIYEHIANLIREPEYGAILIDYLAYMVQQPGKKVRWTILLQGGEGCGKTFIHAMMRVALGRRNTAKINGADIMNGNYNDWAVGKQLVSVEEVRIVGSNRHVVMDKLKPCITDDEIGVNRKYQDHHTVPNVTNYLMFTNYHDALAIREDGRRYFVLSSPLQSPDEIAAIGGSAYFTKLYSAIRDNPGGFRAFLERHPISKNFDPEGRAPVTPYLKDLAENSQTPLMTAVRACLEDAPHTLIQKDLLSLGILRAHLDSHLPPYSDNALGNVLRELGWERYGRYAVSGERHQLWTKGRAKENMVRVAEIRTNFV